MKFINAKDTGEGHSLGQSTDDLISFYGVTPVAQQAGSAQAAVTTTAATSTTPFGYATAAQADGVVSLLNEIRQSLVDIGLIKGAA